MRRNQLRFAVGLCGLATAVALAAPAPGQPPQPNAELARLLDQMEQRQKKAGIIRVKAEGTRFVPKGAFSERSGPPKEPTEKKIDPPTDETTELRQDIIFDFVGQRYRRQYSEKLGNKFDSWVGVYDGKKSYGAKADLPIEQLDSFKPSDLSVTSGAGKANIFNSSWWPYLVSTGFVITHHRKPYFMSEFAIPLDKENLFVHGQGAADGVPCVILRTFPFGPKGQERFLEYAVGRNDGAVRRLTDWRPGPRKDIEITINYRKSGDRLAPVSWVNEWYQPQGTMRLYQSEKMTVTLFEVGDELADRFTLTPAVGASIRERQYPEDIQIIRQKDEKIAHYRVDESGRWVEGEVIDGEFKPHRNFLWWVGGGLVAVLLCVLGWRFCRRRPPTSPASPETGGAT